MKIKPIVAGLIIATSFAVVGTSQAECKTKTCRMQAEFSGLETEFVGTGWQMIPCNTPLRRAQTWAEYTSGSYAPPGAVVVKDSVHER